MLGILVGRSSLLFVWVEKLGCYEWKSWILWGVGIMAIGRSIRHGVVTIP
jgi:hypothetical protein